MKLIRDNNTCSPNALVFTIEAELWAQPLPLRLFLRTDLDLETGEVAVIGRELRRVADGSTSPRLLRARARYLRELGGEFAKQFPKIAGRLGLDAFECADPYVERLLEGFAFLAARVQLKIDAEFPRFTEAPAVESSIRTTWPRRRRWRWCRCEPNHRQGVLTDGFGVPRGSALRSNLGRGEQTACEFRTAHDVDALADRARAASRIRRYVADLGERARCPVARRARRDPAALNTVNGAPVSQLALERLPLFLRGARAAGHAHLRAASGRAASACSCATVRARARARDTDEPVRAVGFEDEEALLPYGPRSFQGYRLLHEYFALPSALPVRRARGPRPPACAPVRGRARAS